MAVGRQDVVDGVQEWVAWWMELRKAKLRDNLSESMSINPFLAPLVYELHNLPDLPDLTSLLTTGHLLTGYNTAFAKLFDEKILPDVFDTTKLGKTFRNSTEPFEEPWFNEIDHLVPRESLRPDLLSLKTSRWSIQLTGAIGLNRSFATILDNYGQEFDEIVVGVLIGTTQDLTDKYDILRGINRGAFHDVADLTEKVKVYAGREFWKWLNGGEHETQTWVLDGILKGVKDTGLREESAKLLETYNQNLAASYGKYTDNSGNVDWHRLLEDING